jgi:hypothetical protein
MPCVRGCDKVAPFLGFDGFFHGREIFVDRIDSCIENAHETYLSAFNSNRTSELEP